MEECYICGCKNTEENKVEFQMDPYDSEIEDDYTEHWLCEKCYDIQSDDI
jgi:hypothetical protein